MDVPKDWDAILRLAAVTAIVIFAIWALGRIFSHHFLRIQDYTKAAKLEFKTLMGLFSFLGFCAMLIFFSERSLFQEIKTFFFPYDFHSSGEKAAHHEDGILIVGLVIAFLGNLFFIAIMTQKGRR